MPEQMSSPPVEIRLHDGAPTFFLNGEPQFLSVLWVVRPAPDHWGHAEESWPLPHEGRSDTAQRTAATGIHIYTFGAGCEWCGPGPGRSGSYDFSTLGPALQRIIDTDSQARFYLQVHLEPGRWWADLHRDECEVTSEGWQPDPSYASKLWRREAKEFLSALVGHIEQIGMAHRVIMYQVGAGETTEWTRFSSSGAEPCGDYSAPMRQHFRDYLRRIYGNDRAALQAAWNDPICSFDTAEAPSVEQQIQTQHYTFRDPQRERHVIDYFQCLAELCSDLVIDFCATVKQATHGRALAGAMYGYTMTCSFNEIFYNQGKHAPTEYSHNQRGGHLGVRRVLESPAVDFLSSPMSYGFRGIGGDGPSAFLADSVSLHGKMCLIQDDSRLHDCPYPNRYGKTRNMRESVTILRRNFNKVVTHGDGNWRSPLREPGLLSLSKAFNAIGAFAVHTDRRSCAEIAVLVDEQSFIYESIRYNLDLFNVSQQCLQGLPRLGAPFALYHLDDFIDGLVPPHRLYVFLNAFCLDGRRREKLARELKRDGRVAAWVYAPGYIRDDCSVEHMAELTGFRFGVNLYPWPPFMHISDFDHPITSGLPQDLFWGCTHAVAPLLYLDDPEARELGQVVFSVGSCLPGLGVKTLRDWTSIYLAVPNAPAAVWRGIARFAGVHLYSDQGDVLHVSPQLLGVHTVSGGKRTFALRKTVQRVHDLYNDRPVASNTDQFTVVLEPRSTELFYTGDEATLARLNRWHAR